MSSTQAIVVAGLTKDYGDVQAVRGIDGRSWRLHRIPRKVHPFQKVANLVSADTKCDLQHLQTGDLLTQSAIEARTTLLNEPEVKREKEQG